MNYFGNCSIKFRNFNEDIIYEVDININGSSFIVNLGQIYDIPATATSSLRAPRELPDSITRASRRC
jgi:hypothetical protein